MCVFHNKILCIYLLSRVVHIMCVRSSLFWDFIQHILVVCTDVLVQPIGPIFKGHAVQKESSRIAWPLMFRRKCFYLELWYKVLTAGNAACSLVYGLFQSLAITCPCVWGAIVSGLVRMSIFPSSMSLISCLISKHYQKNLKINVVLHVFSISVFFACIQWFPFVLGSLKMVSKVCYSS